MSITPDHVKESSNFLLQKGFKKAEIGIILGTGMGAFVDEVQNPITVPYEEIPHFPVSTVEFHKGRLIFGQVDGKNVLVMQGRFHFYEGYTMEQITFPLRVMHEMGIGKLLVSNAAGAINPEYKKGELMIIQDHIHLMGDSPLAQANIGEFGNRFVDLFEPYSLRLIELAEQISKDNKIHAQKGIYVSVKGPQLETKAEYRYLSIIGADAVGMSTTPEAIVANQLNIETFAVSVLTDECYPGALKPIDIQEILDIAKNAEPKLIKLFKEIIKKN